jgi:transposase
VPENFVTILCGPWLVRAAKVAGEAGGTGVHGEAVVPLEERALLGWAGRWRQRTWAIEGARGLGNLLAQQLIAAGERVLDVPPKLTARVRLPDSGQINKTDENDARAVAIAALRARELPQLTVEDQTIVMRVWARRYHDLGRLRTQPVCRLHTVLCELVPGGVRRQLRTSQAVAVVDGIVADSPVAQAKLELAGDLVADLQRIDAQRREVKRPGRPSGRCGSHQHHRGLRRRADHSRHRARLRPRYPALP